MKQHVWLTDWLTDKATIKDTHGWMIRHFDFREQVDFARKFGSPNAPVDTKCSVCGDTFARHTKTQCWGYNTEKEK
jgi:hypothetical protein